VEWGTIPRATPTQDPTPTTPTDTSSGCTPTLPSGAHLRRRPPQRVTVEALMDTAQKVLVVLAEGVRLQVPVDECLRYTTGKNQMCTDQRPQGLRCQLPQPDL